MSAKSIHLDGVTKRFDQTLVIPELTTEIRGGEFTVILGPSGCGKSTLLNLLAGLEQVSDGVIRFGEREVQDVPAKDRGCAMVFQNYALYPHMSVAHNIGYALKLAGVPRLERERRIQAVAEPTGLTEYLDRRPSQLSGGQRQRVAIARAIVREPDIMLFDEPLSNLDAKLRHSMRMELSELHSRLGATSIFVTHDQVEAMTLADRILILNGGRIEQFDTPEAIYNRPASAFVAGFIGSPPMNLIETTRAENGLLSSRNSKIHAGIALPGPATLGIRPEQVRLVPSGDGIPVTIVYREDLGSHAILVAELADGQRLQIATPIGAKIGPDEVFDIALPTDALHFFDPKTGTRLDKTAPEARY